MSGKKSKRELLPPDMILRAVTGDRDAIQEVIDHYEKQIHADFVYLSQKQGIHISHMPLADMEQEVRIHLINAVKKFKL